MKPPKSHWNHRVMRIADEHGEDFSIREVHYSKGKPNGYVDEPVSVSAESVEDLRWVLEQMMLALDKPILDGDNFPKEWKPTFILRGGIIYSFSVNRTILDPYIVWGYGTQEDVDDLTRRWKSGELTEHFLPKT